jgi:23S rRNA G2445 N2-methylase RlmL
MATPAAVASRNAEQAGLSGRVTFAVADAYEVDAHRHVAGTVLLLEIMRAG